MSIISSLASIITKGRKIRFKQGLEANLPSDLDIGEPAFTIDKRNLYIGSTSGNVKVLTEADAFSADDIPLVTIAKDGLMPKDDKLKLNGISAGANHTTVIDNLTSTSSTSAASANQVRILKGLIDNLPVGGGSVALSPATTTTLGGIKVGNYLSVETDGKLNINEASTSVVGVTKLNDTTTSTSTTEASTARVAKVISDKIDILTDETNTRLVNISDSVSDLNTTLTTHLAQTNLQSQTIQHGLSVINGEVGSPLDLQINGRTLVNILGVDGRGITKTKTVTLDVVKYYLFIKYNATQNITATEKITGVASKSLDWTDSDFASVYEITLDTYNEIGILTDVDAERMFPYVDGVKHLQNPYLVAEGENLLPQNDDAFYNRSGEGYYNNVWVDGKLEIYNGSVNYVGKGFLFKGVKGQTYTLSFDVERATDGTVLWVNINDGYISHVSGSFSTKITLTNTDSIIVNFIRAGESSATDTVKVKNIMLIVGSTPKPFSLRNPSYLYASDIKLGAIGDKKDILFKSDGKWLLRKVVDTEATTPSLLTSSQTIDVTDKVEGSLNVNGLTQVEVGSGFTYADVDGKRTYTITPSNQRYNQTVNAIEVVATYANNIRTALEETVKKQSNIATDVSIHNRSIIDLYVRLKALEGI